MYHMKFCQMSCGIRGLAQLSVFAVALEASLQWPSSLIKFAKGAHSRARHSDELVPPRA
jgi:hypothetical protein